MIGCCFQGGFTVYATSDNDPYVVFGVPENPCISGFDCCLGFLCPDVSRSVGLGEAMLPAVPAGLVGIGFFGLRVLLSGIRANRRV